MKKNLKTKKKARLGRGKEAALPALEAERAAALKTESKTCSIP